MKDIRKRCFKCKQWKYRSEFYKHSQMADGLLGKCKNCTKKDALEHRNANIERIRANDRERGKLPHRIALSIAKTKIFRRLNPEKYAAHLLLNNGVRSGKIKKPRLCTKCGKPGRIHGHHEDYCKPLDVIWVCQICHKRIYHGNHRSPKRDQHTYSKA